MLLEMRNIRKTFPGVVALNQVNLQVQAGEIHAIVGENGAGKSTLMKVCLLYTSPSPRDVEESRMPSSA